VLKFIEAISEKTLRSTVALTAARGRGKSAAMGMAVAAAVAFGYRSLRIATALQKVLPLQMSSVIANHFLLLF